MTKYQLESKDAFAVIGFGTTVQYGEGADKFAHITAQKQTLWQDIAADGRLDTLKKVAADHRLLAVNEAVNQEMWYYAGVISDQAAPQDAKTINFPAGEYLVVTGQAATPGELFGQLEGQVFGQVLPNTQDFAYVGGPNAAVETSVNDAGVQGEMWVPVVRRK